MEKTDKNEKDEKRFSTLEIHGSPCTKIFPLTIEKEKGSF